MNDPGFHKHIADQSKAAETSRDEDEEEEEEEQAFLQPSRWWFASTAFPLIAGTFGPMASAFSILALVSHWRQDLTQPDNDTEYTSNIFLDDPKWLIGINAAQLAIALTSNLFLLLNMAKRVSFSVAQPITIIGWYISSFALIGLLATSTGPLNQTDVSNWAYSQAFYYAIFSAALYFIVATLMALTAWGALTGHYDRDFQLTMSQRTLMLQTISFLVYLLAGAAIYSHLEGWNYLDAVYWADYTLLTVGVGNYAPSTQVGRGLLFPFAIGGVIILGLVIGSIRSLVLERGKVKMEARGVEKERERLLKRMHKKGDTDILMPVKSDDSSGQTKVMGAHRAQTFGTERDRRRDEFELMRMVQRHAADKRRWVALGISGTTWLALWFVGAAIFQASEKGPQDWSYFTALYFAYVSLLTIGYGDIYPKSNAGTAFFVFWSLLAIPSLTILISNMGDTVVKGVRDLTIWIGEFTVLPGEKGFRVALKHFLHKMTGGKLFDGDLREEAPGLLGEAGKRRNDEEDEDDGHGRHRKNDPESVAQKLEKKREKHNKHQASLDNNDNDDRAMPKSQLHYHVLLVEEIGNVMQHLTSSPPRRYTYDEWAWFLRLIGEDESDASRHRVAQHKPQGNGTMASAGQDHKQPKQWSWMGARSPLMGNKEESEWVLEKLQKQLSRELKHLRRVEIEAGGDEESGDEKSEHEEGSEARQQARVNELKAAGRKFDNMDGAGKLSIMAP